MTSGAARARRRSRELLVQAVYQWQITGHSEQELISQFDEDHGLAAADRRHFKKLLPAVLASAPAYDEIIARHAVRAIEQLDVVGRAVLLSALAELANCDDVPTKVIINEAVDLAKRFGPAESFKFINAVLDKASRDLRGEDK